MDEQLPEQFEQFYLSCRDRVAVHVAALTGDRVEALDHAQEAFVRAWTRWAQVSVMEDPEGWVRRVAYNLAVSRFRRARRLVLGSPAIDGTVEFDDAGHAVLDGLTLLPRREREALVLKHVVGLSVAEIATELRVPEGTVKSWLSRGRAHLSVLLAENEEELDEAR